MRIIRVVAIFAATRICIGMDKSCKYCGAALPENAQFCPACGKSTTSKENGINRIKYLENKDGKSFEAIFSDDAAGNVAAIFARFVNIVPAADGKVIRSVLAREESHSNEGGSEIDSESSNSNSGINAIFKRKGDSILLSTKNLKARNKTDNLARVCLLYLYYCQVNNLGDITRDKLYSFMKGAKLFSNTFRFWMYNNDTLFTKSGDVIELSLEGEERAKAYLSEVFDENKRETWSPGAAVTPTSVKKSKSKPSSQLVFLENLNLSPADKESLEAFMARHNHRDTAPQLNLLFVYYLKHILKLDGINKDHVYTCYRSMGVKLPKDLYHTLADTISKNQWLLNISNLDLTSKGLNVVEHEMRTK